MINPKEKELLPRILVPSIRNLIFVPPVVNFINFLESGLAKITVISYSINPEMYRERIELIQISKSKYPTQLVKRITAKIYAYLFFYSYLFRNAKYFDYIWVGIWEYKFLDKFAKLFGFKGKIIYHFHELEFEKLKYCRKADFCVVPEENRLWIAYFMGKLRRKPLLLPNIPFLYFDLSAEMPKEILEIRNKGKKVLLYQGNINFERRCLNELLTSISLVPESIALVIIPVPHTPFGLIKKLTEKIEELNISSQVVIIEPKMPPHHLNYVKHADVGIGLYRPITLNQVYAAPNRLFEFTKFSVPLILPDFPAFKALSSIYKDGILVVDPESPREIAKIITGIFEPSHLNEGKEQAKLFFEENGNYESHAKRLWNEIIN